MRTLQPKESLNNKKLYDANVRQIIVNLWPKVTFIVYDNHKLLGVTRNCNLVFCGTIIYIPLIYTLFMVEVSTLLTCCVAMESRKVIMSGGMKLYPSVKTYTTGVIIFFTNLSKIQCFFSTTKKGATWNWAFLQHIYSISFLSMTSKNSYCYTNLPKCVAI